MEGEAVIAILLGAALAVFSLVIAGYPIMRDALFRPANRADAAPLPDADGNGLGPESVYDAPDAIYDSIATLELDYQLGNLPETEYRRQLQAYRHEAAEAIRAQLEREVTAWRSSPESRSAENSAVGNSGLENSPLENSDDVAEPRPPPGATAACPECDAPIPAALRGPCPGCGAAVALDGGSPGVARL